MRLIDRSYALRELFNRQYLKFVCLNHIQIGLTFNLRNVKKEAWFWKIFQNLIKIYSYFLFLCFWKTKKVSLKVRWMFFHVFKDTSALNKTFEIHFWGPPIFLVQKKFFVYFLLNLISYILSTCGISVYDNLDYVIIIIELKI